jgi:hypothetical protein
MRPGALELLVGLGPDAKRTCRSPEDTSCCGTPCGAPTNVSVPRDTGSRSQGGLDIRFDLKFEFEFEFKFKFEFEVRCFPSLASSGELKELFFSALKGLNDAVRGTPSASTDDNSMSLKDINRAGGTCSAVSPVVGEASGDSGTPCTRISSSIRPDDVFHGLLGMATGVPANAYRSRVSHAWLEQVATGDAAVGGTLAASESTHCIS